MKNFQNKKTLQIVLLVVIAVVTLGIGYAAISAINLFINGNATASVNQNNFKVYFTSTTDTPSLTGNVTVTGSVEINNQDNTVATFNVGGLTKVGDYAIATYTVLNDSEAIGAELSLNVTNANSEYFRVTESVTDTQLQAGDTTTATVKVEMIKTPITDSVMTSVTTRLTAAPLENASATGGGPASKIAGDPESFATDSWATIQTAVRNNNTSAYSVGDTKEVTINNKNYTLRIANKTTGEHCGDNDTAYSQTACGFVVEFVDIIEQRKMNSTETNVGGWPGSELYTYLQGTFYNSLPSDLKSAIKPTRVISGYGCLSDVSTCTNPDNNENNFITTDKLYLLSGKELALRDDYDTAESTTHILEYYVGKSDSYRKKQYNGYNIWYWLRTAYSNSDNAFRSISNGGYWYGKYDSTNSFGLAPAFRIG